MDWFKIILFVGIGFVVYQLFFAANPIPFFDQFKGGSDEVIPGNDDNPIVPEEPDVVIPEEVLPQVSDYLELNFIDVGQGDSILIKYPSNQYVLVDGGNRYKGGVVSNYLLSINVSEIHTVVATHNDADHIGGLIKVFNTFDVRRFLFVNLSCDTLTCEELMSVVYREDNCTIIDANTGISYYVDNYTRTQIFNPPKFKFNNDRNSNSIVLKITYKDNSFLLTGDCDFDCENEMRDTYKILDSDLLKVGHHGGDTSTSKEFVNLVSPVISIISVGNNNYGHPSINVIKNLIDTKIYRTDELGHIVVRSDGSRMEVLI